MTIGRRRSWGAPERSAPGSAADRDPPRWSRNDPERPIGYDPERWAGLDSEEQAGPDSEGPAELDLGEFAGSGSGRRTASRFGEAARSDSGGRAAAEGPVGPGTGGRADRAAERRAEQSAERRARSAERRAARPRKRRPERSPEQRAERTAERAERTAERRSRAAADVAADPGAAARAIILRQLTMGARTRAQLQQALARKDIPDDVATAVLDRFEEVDLVDDEEFARQWVQSRHLGRGLARRALAYELRQRGVAEETLKEAVDELTPDDELTAARELVRRKAATMRKDDPQRRVRRLAGMLARKGYGGGIAMQAIREELADLADHADEAGLDFADDDSGD